MITAQIPLLGLMDLDSSNEAIKPGYHKRARNIMFRGGRAENLLGTRKIAYTLPAGTNECIGSYYDPTKQRTIWFNWNSNNKHGIYQMVNEVITSITVCDATDYLNFTKDPIHSVNILYGDETLGDVLYFIDSLKRPTKINITRAIAGGYGTMQRSYLNVAKEPPTLPPLVAYASDSTTVNNLQSSVFQFAYTWVFDDKEESTLSFFSQVPVPIGILNPNQPVTSNAKLSVTLQTGPANVKKIKLYVRHNVEGNYSDLALVDIFDKPALAIGNNTTYIYDFKNNSIGVTADIKFATLLFDYVPRETNTQELVNGNVVVYGGVKEGYNNGITPNVTYTVDTSLLIDGPFDITPAYSFWSWYTFAMVYFDDQMRTNGVAYETKISAYTGADPGTGIPRINVSVAHRPPVWATSYQWVRTKNNSKSKFIQWISDSTYKDDKYAYIGIQNLYTKLPEQNTKSVLSYDFSPGDRVRILRIGTSGTMIGKDYAIEEFVNSPEINYVPKTGFYLKIKLPTTSGAMDFGVNGFGNYLIEIYTPAESTSDKLNTYYEFGEVYQIGNAGLINRYHKGQTQDQAADLSAPATFSFTKGDVYLKMREINVGSGAQYHVDSGDAWGGNMFIGAHFDNRVVGNETFELAERPFSELPLSAGTDNQWLIRTHADPYVFRIRGSIKVNSPINLSYKVYIAFFTWPTAIPTVQIDVIPTRTLNTGDNEMPFDKTFTVPANTSAYLVTHNSNNQAVHYYTTTFSITSGNALSKKMFDPNFSDTFLSAVNSNGRPFVVDEGMVETYKPDMLRFSEAYQSGTNINHTNRFYPLNYETCDRAKGDIQRLKVRGDALRAYQYRGVLPFGIYKQMLTNAEGSSSLIQSEKILNRIKYYDGDYGIGNQTCSLASSSSADYFTDPVRGYHVRLAGDGMTPISEIYKAQYYLPPIVSNYLKNYTTDSGAPSKIMGVYDYFNEEFVSIFQKCIKDSVPVFEGETLGFSEQRNGYSSHYDFIPESIVCAENTFIMWKDGEIYRQDSTSMNTFFGEYSPSQIEIVVNADPNVKKEFLSIGYHSNEVWECPEITTALLQESNLIRLPSDFVFTEGMYTAAFLRDYNSPGGVSEGDYLKGVWAQVLLQSDSPELTYLSGLYCNYSPSPKVF